jgi:dTDP-4-dehydrorhamnose reductase
VRIAITGANGLLGGAAVLRLAAPVRPERSAAEGGAESNGAHEILAIGRGPCRLPPGAFAWADADLGDGRSVERALLDFRPDAVLHAGAMTDVDGCERDPEGAWRVNVGGTEQVARACRQLNARLVAVSTDYVFDGSAGPYSEDDVPNPRGIYARTKRCGEEAALVLAPNCAVARVGVVYSGRPGAKSTFATQVVEKLSRGEPVKAFSDQYVTTTLAESGAAMCLELLLETDYRGVLHTSDATVLDRVDFARRIADQFRLAGEIIPVKTADVRLLAPRPLRGGLKVGRAAALLRNKPLAIDAALERFRLEWERRPGASRAGATQPNARRGT